MGDVRVAGLDALDLVPVTKTFNTAHLLARRREGRPPCDGRANRLKGKCFFYAGKILLDEPVVRRRDSLPLLWSCEIRLEVI